MSNQLQHNSQQQIEHFQNLQNIQDYQNNLQPTLNTQLNLLPNNNNNANLNQTYLENFQNQFQNNNNDQNIINGQVHNFQNTIPNGINELNYGFQIQKQTFITTTTSPAAAAVPPSSSRIDQAIFNVTNNHSPVQNNLNFSQFTQIPNVQPSQQHLYLEQQPNAGQFLMNDYFPENFIGTEYEKSF